MKTKHLLAVFAAVSGHCLALTPVTDSFYAETLKPTRWSPVNNGNGVLEPMKGKLNFVVSTKPVGTAISYLELISSNPGTDENWQMTIDLTNRANKEFKVGCGFFLTNKDDRLRDYLHLGFYGKGGISGGIFKDGSPVTNGTFGEDWGISKGAVRLQFNKTKNLVSLFASLKTKSQGYQFVKVGTFSPDGSGGDLNADWQMNSTSTFVIQLYTFSTGIQIDPGVVLLNNFELSRPLAAPALQDPF